MEEISYPNVPKSGFFTLHPRRPETNKPLQSTIFEHDIDGK